MSREERRREPVEVKSVQALRPAGRALIVAPWDPKKPTAPVPKAAEVMIPVSEIDLSSEVKKQGDKGTLVIPQWLAEDRELDFED